jgi:hypothetical protein
MHRLHHGEHHPHHGDGHNHRHAHLEDSAEDVINKFGREVTFFSSSAVTGAIKAAQSRWKHDAAGVCLEAGTAATTGIAFGLVAEAAPVVATGVGVTAAANYLWNSLNPKTHVERNATLSSAWNGVWNSNNQTSMNYYKQKVSPQIGDGVFDFALCTGFGTTGFSCAEIGMRSGISSQLHPNLQLIPGPNLEHPLSAAMRRIQIGGSNSSGMKGFVDGDRHALDRGRLSLAPEPLMGYENAVRIPNPDGRLGLRYYVRQIHHAPTSTTY